MTPYQQNSAIFALLPTGSSAGSLTWTPLDVCIMFMCEDVCVSMSATSEYMQVWGSEEDVGEVLFLNVFVFSSLPVCGAVGSEQQKVQ